MKEFQSIAKNFITNHKKHNRYMAILIVMCLIVFIVVHFSLIKPAISQTGELCCGVEEHQHTEECYTLICEDTSEEHEHIEECYQNICNFQEHTHNLECYTSTDENVNNYVQLNQDEPIYNAFDGFNMVGGGAETPNETPYPLGSDGSTITSFKAKNSSSTDGNTIDKVLTDFTLSYRLEASLFSNGTITYGTPMTYKLDTTKIKIIPNTSGVFNDSEHGKLYDGDAGTYTISSDGLITLKLNQNYYSKLYNEYLSKNGAYGNIGFTAYTIRGESDTNDVTFGEGENSSTINFPAKKIGIQKENVLNPQTGEITWTIKINNPAGLDLKGYVVKDIYLKSSNASVNPSNTNGIFSDGAFTFDPNTTNKQKETTITYKTTLGSPDEYQYTQWNGNAVISNSAQLFQSDGQTQVGSNVASNCYVNPVTISKTNGTVTEGKIPWTITISNPSGLDLTGYTITDTYINNPTITYEPSNATMKLDNNYKFVETATDNNKLRPTKITITYVTDLLKVDTVNPFENGSINNIASIQGDNNYSKSANDTVYYSGVNLSKSGSLSESAGEITWTLTINNTSQFDLNGFTITDAKFPSNFSNSLGTYDDTTKTFTFSSQNPINSTPITLEYTTKLSDEFNDENPINPKGGDIENSATIKKDTHKKDANTSVHYNGVSISSKSGSIADNGTITWTITIDNPNGMDIGGYTITDTKFNSTYNPTLIDGSSYGSFNDDKTLFTFNPNVKDKTITLKYTTHLNSEDDSIKSNGGTITNTATLKNGNTDVSTNNGSVTILAPISVTKSGVFDYQYSVDSKTYPTDNKIVWTINIKSNYGGNLAGQTIKDSMFVGKSLADLGLADKSSQLTISDDTLTISNEATNLTELIIVYTASKDITSNMVNVGGKEFSYTVQGNYEPYTINKFASAVVDQLVTWTITVTKTTNATSLNGFVVTDTMFANRVGNIQVNGSDINPDSLSGSDLTLNVADNVQQVTITYKTKAIDTSGFGDTPSDEQKASITNNTTLKYNGIIWDTSSAIQPDYTPVNTITKNYIDDTLNDTTGGTIKWNVIVKKDLGFANVVIDDTISTDDSNATHTITGKQLKELKVYSSNSTQDYVTYTLLSSNYTIQDSNSTTIDLGNLEDTTTYTGFKIAFNGDMDSNIVNIKVEYSTTADITYTTVDTTVIFTNDASVTGITNSSSANKEVTKFNAENQPFKKYPLSTDNKLLGANSTRTLDDLQKITINETEYYLFTWCIFIEGSRLNITNDGSSKTFTDILPESFTLCTEGDYSPKIAWPYSGQSFETYTYYNFDNYNSYSYDNNTKTITFTLNGLSSTNIPCIKYNAMISVAEFNNKFNDGKNEVSVSNIVSSGDTRYSPYTDIQTIKKENTPSGGDTSEDILDKTVTPDTRFTGILKYSIDVNPEAKTLSSDGNLVLNDIFNITSCVLGGNTVSNVDISQFSIDVTSFQVSEVDSDGKSTKISNSEYSYVLSSPKTTYTPVSGITTSITDNIIYVKGFPLASSNVYSIKVTFEGEVNDNLYFDLIPSLEHHYNYLYRFNNTVYQRDYSNNKTTFIFNIPVYDVNTNYSWVSNPEICLKIHNFGSNANNISFMVEVNEAITENFAKKIQMVVPDGKHLRIEYYYNVSFNGNGLIKGDKISTSNSVSINTGNYSDTSTKTADAFMFDDSQSNIGTASLPKIQKHDVGNYSIHLVADFKIAKWDGSNWQYPKKMNPVTNDVGELKGYEFGTDLTTTKSEGATIQTTNGEYSISLDSGVLYKLEEVQAPENYNLLSKPIYFVSGSKSSISNIPSEASNIIDISNQGGLKVPNSKNINITVQKDWSDGNHASDEITVQLYKSTSKVATAEELEPVLDSNEKIITKPLNSGNSWEATFSGYPNGDDDGNPLYYYVKEISYTINGKTYTLNPTTNKYEYTNDGTVETGDYTPYYTDNAVSQTNTDNPVKILNTTGLKIQKVWYNANNMEISPPVEEIQFELYYTLDNENNKIKYPNTAREDGNFILGKDNDWKLELNLPSTIEGKKCTYFVEEVNPIEGYTVSYVSNSDGNTGTIQIINKNPNGPETFNLEVEKQWADGNINHNTDSVTLELWRKSSSDTTGEKVQDITLNKDSWQKSISVEAYLVNETGDYVLDSDNNKIKYEYYIKEVSTNSNYSVTYNNTDSSTSPNIDIDTNSKKIVVTNTPTNDIPIDINVTKQWGTYPSSVSKPESITVNLYKSFTENASESDWKVPENIVDTKTLNDGGNWSCKFENLAGYLYYHVVEEVPDGWTASYSIDNPINKTSDVTITNTYAVDVGSLTVNKSWKDINGNPISNFNELNSITIQLYRYTTDINSSTSVGEKVTINSSSWTCTFDNLEVDDGTNPYHYYVVEDTIDGYQTTYSNDVTITKDENSTITITNQATNINIDITKQWSDNGIHQPIKVKVYRSTDSSKVPKPEDTPSENNVKYTFNGLEANDSIIAINGTSLDTPLTSQNNEISYPKDTTITNYTIVRSYSITIQDTDIGINGSNLNFTVKNGDGFTFNLNGTEISDITQAITINSSDVGTTKTLTATKNVSIGDNDIDENNNISVGTLPTISHNITQNSTSNDYQEISFSFTSIGESKVFSEVDFSKTIQKITLEIAHSNGAYEYEIIKFDDNNKVKVGHLGNDGFKIEYANKTNINATIVNEKLEITFIDKYQPTSITVTADSSQFGDSKLIIYYAITENETDNQSNKSSSNYSASRMNFNFAMATNDNNTLEFTPTTEDTNIEVAEITINSNNWTENISVPKSNANGSDYYYWVVEDLTDNNLSTAYQDPQYNYNSNSNNYYISGADGSVTITNTKIDTTSSMPSTGGTGTMKYYIIGGTIISSALILNKLRKRQSLIDVK